MVCTATRALVGWYFWRQRFAAGQTRLRVAYTLTGGGLCQTNYVLRTPRGLWEISELFSVEAAITGLELAHIVLER